VLLEADSAAAPESRQAEAGVSREEDEEGEAARLESEGGLEAAGLVLRGLTSGSGRLERELARDDDDGRREGAAESAENCEELEDPIWQAAEAGPRAGR